MSYKRSHHKNALMKLVNEKRMVLLRDAKRIMNANNSLQYASESLEKEGKIKRQKVKMRFKNGNLNDVWLVCLKTVKYEEILEYEKELINLPYSSPLKEHHCYKKKDEAATIETVHNSDSDNKVVNMSDYVKIGDSDLEIKEYKGERVVTAADIALLHGKETREITYILKRNQRFFIEAEDYFIIAKSESISNAFKNLFTSNRQKEAYLFTESGYLMLTKSFTDDLSWTIQRELVKSYFKVKELKQDQSLQTVPQIDNMQTYDLMEMMLKGMRNHNNRIEDLEQKINKIADAFSS